MLNIFKRHNKTNENTATSAPTLHRFRVHGRLTNGTRGVMVVNATDTVQAREIAQGLDGYNPNNTTQRIGKMLSVE